MARLARFAVHSAVGKSMWIAVAFALSTAACGNVKGGIFRRGASSTEPDFLKTEIIANGSAVADGISELVVGIQLKNSDLSVVADYKPTYKIVSGFGVVAGECTKSLANGMSYCLLKATQPGVKRMRLENARVGLERDLVFDPTAGKPGVRGLVTSSQPFGQTAGGYKIESSTGSNPKETKVSTSDGYKVFLNVQGTLSSR